MVDDAQSAPVQYKGIMVSSTFTDLEHHREALIKAIKGQGLTDIAMENDSAKPDLDVIDSSLRMVRDASAYVGVISRKYGQTPRCPERNPGGRSLTELEFNEAQRLERPILLFVMGDGHLVQEADVEIDATKRRKLEQFRERAKQMKPDSPVHRVYATFDSLGDFAQKAIHAVAALRRCLDAETTPSGQPQPAATAPPPVSGTAAEETAEYLRRLDSAHESIALSGFETRIRVPIQLEDLYVPLSAIPDFGGQHGAEFADAEDALKRVGRDRADSEIPLAEAFRWADRSGHRRGVVILGDPGSGKTTHLKRLLLSVIRGESAALGLPAGIIPVFLPLRDLRDYAGELDAFVEAKLDEHHRLAEKGFGRRMLRDGRLLFLLDGLDEVPDEQHRGEVAGWIEKALVDYPQGRFIVTCRYAGYGKRIGGKQANDNELRLSERFLELHLRPMSAEQAQAFISNWYRIVETSLRPGDERASDRATEQAEALWSRLQEPDFRARKVFELTRNPLLLTAICLVHRDRGRLPNRRVDLYDECVKVLLERWRESKKLDVQVGAKEALMLLEPMAYWLHEKEGRIRATADELSPVIEPLLPRIRRHEEGSARFLRTIRDESGLLTGWSGDRYGFMHLGFQEYLTARAIRNRAFQDKTVLSELASHFGESWWREVSLLLVALGDPPLFEPFMQNVVGLPTFSRHGDLVGECLDDAVAPVPEPFLELLKRKPGRDEALWSCQLQALRILEQIWPERLDSLRPNLARHPSAEIRALVSAAPELDVFVSDPGGYELVRIPGGTFEMGGKRHGDEQPIHEVTLVDFYLGQSPVTNEEYGRYLAANPDVQEPRFWADRKYNQPRQPVVGVSWDEARAYCEWSGLELPSEAQWEHACRGGKQTRSEYWSGDTDADLARVGWYNGNSDGRLHAVGEKEANPFGLHDMHGNVWEWCQDLWHASYKGAPNDGSAWEEDGASFRVQRGGSFYYDADACRSAYRFYYYPGSRYDLYGFRPARRITS